MSKMGQISREQKYYAILSPDFYLALGSFIGLINLVRLLFNVILNCKFPIIKIVIII